MNENRIITWDEAERILGDSGQAPVKSSLPEQTRPSEPDNDTDADRCILQLQQNDPKLKQINLNNMKVSLPFSCNHEIRPTTISAENPDSATATADVRLARQHRIGEAQFGKHESLRQQRRSTDRKTFF
jgi:hypothetical protein